DGQATADAAAMANTEAAVRERLRIFMEAPFRRRDTPVPVRHPAGCRGCTGTDVRMVLSRADTQSLIRVNCSQVPIAVRLAMNEDAPAFSAVTYMLLACDWRLIVPLELWTRVKLSHAPIAVR